MNRNLKKVFVLVFCCAILSIICVLSVGASSVSYNTTGKTNIATVSNTNPYSVRLSVNTRPTTGQGGARITVQKGGSVVASKIFPYQTSTSDLTTIIPSGEVRVIYVAPYTSGQRIAGTVSYSVAPVARS